MLTAETRRAIVPVSFLGFFFYVLSSKICYLYLKPGCLFVHELKKRFKSSIVEFLPFNVGLRLYLGSTSSFFCILAERFQYSVSAEGIF